MSRWLAVLVALVVCVLVSPAAAHEFRPALLRVDQRADELGRYDLRLVIPPVSEGGPIEPGELTPIVPAHCQLHPRSELAFTLDCGEAGLVGELGIAGLDRHPIDVLVDVRYADASRFTGVLGPDQPAVELRDADARAHSVFADYLRLGVEHILLGLDHLLFVFGLVLLISLRQTGRTTRDLLVTVTAFTLAHSLTLAASTLSLVELPSPPVEAGIALSILLLARELALDMTGGERDTLTWRYPWLVAFGFGLLHGFGFAGALREVGLPPEQTPLALLAFNVGVEAGQLGVVALLLLGLAGLARVRARIVSPNQQAFATKLTLGLAVWTMGALAFAWTLERVLGFWG